MAYFRVLFERSGARLADTYQRLKSNGTPSPQIPLHSEPVYEAALDFARQELARGITQEDKLRVAGRSSEFHAANAALQKGSKLADLKFTPSIFTRPLDLAPPARKPWWQRLKQ